MSRVVVWFSCGRAFAVAAKLAIDKYGSDVVVAYCASVESSEHPDNARFMADCERWYGIKILRLYSDDYRDTWDVWSKTRWLVGVKGARCTTELKKRVRFAFQRSGDLQVFGFMAHEQKRIELFKAGNPDIQSWFPLFERGLAGHDCSLALSTYGIELPAMYRLGYRNNNCIGCVKGQMGYWNKIRKDFPAVFSRMALLERSLDVAICKTELPGSRQRVRVFLDELPPGAGRYQEEPEWECGVACASAQDKGQEAT